MTNDPHLTLTAGRFIARRTAPYFRAIILALVPREAPGLGTVGVTDNGFLLWDPAKVATWTHEQMGGAWLHEALHKLNKHSQRRGSRDPSLFNIANDLAINTTVRQMGAELPPGVVWPALYKFPEGLSSEEYYELLLKNPPKGGSAAGEGDGDGPCCAGGWCGSAAGRAVPNEPPGTDPDSRSEAQIERALRETAEDIRAFAAKNPGKLPGSLQRWADTALAPPKVSWRQKLAKATRNAVAWATGAVDQRYDAPSRRQAGLGYGPGRPVLPRYRRPVPRVAVGVDTSGSMGKAELQASLTEASGVLKAVGADVDFIACDARVHAVAKVSSVADMVKNLKGGGGTDFRPIFAAVEKLTPRPQVFIFATDGYGPAPEAPPPGVRVIWLLVGKGAPCPAEWGEAINVDDLDLDDE